MRLPICLCLLLFMMPAAAEPASASVERLHAALLESMRGGVQMSCAQRLQLLDAAVGDSFDVAGLARLVLRRHWASLDRRQQATFVELLRRNIGLNYAQHFARHAGERFETTGETAVETAADGQRRVSARLLAADAEPVSFDYVLTPSGDSWRIVNVFADGVSDVALRRSQYDSVVGRQGVAALLEQAAAQNEDLLRRCNQASRTGESG
ncbi:ABC transporter substrate-binding protein [Fontimonas sp. SYSU GA230001]|uniref:ABC transporter substrate-binding protein n=1 Tax=Fontimonas sp. SYSU GA230001 TaxID=3142450 RepID=UPI0032B39E41